MAFPNHTEVESKALELGADPIQVFAFAGRHGRLPGDLSELLGFRSQAESFAQRDDIRVEPVFVYGYMQSRGGFPPGSKFGSNSIGEWMIQNGFMDQEGRGTGRQPFAGQGYPPGGAPINAPVTTPSDGMVPAPSTGGFDVSSLLKPPTVYLVGGLGAYMLLKGRR